MSKPTEPLRPAPHNIEAEQALLGAILVNNDAWWHVQDFLLPQHFFDPLHGRIYTACGHLVGANSVATPITLKPFFENEENILPHLTVPQYLGRLAASATTVINAEHYGRTVRDLFIRRSLIVIGEDMVNLAYDARVDVEAESIVEAAEQRILEVIERGHMQNGPVHISEALVTAVDMAANAYRRDGGLAGLTSGFRELDARLGGLHPSDLVVLAGRPSMGKSALAMNIACRVAEAHLVDQNRENPLGIGAPVAVWSLEMSNDQLATRLISEETGIPSNRIRRGSIDRAEWDKIIYATEQKLPKLPIYLDQSGSLNVDQLCARARRLKRQKHIGLIIIDYIQLLSGGRSARGPYNRVAEVSEITTKLKALAKDLDVPVLALSQLSRNVEQREDKRPQLSDLRESGSIEQDADVVLFVFREEYYVTRRRPKEGTTEHLSWEDEMRSVEGRAEVIIGKQRHGPTGLVRLRFNGTLTTFSDEKDDADAAPMGALF